MATYEQYSYRVVWSLEDQEHMGLCEEFPSLSWLAKTPVSALGGIMQLVASTLDDLTKSKEPIPVPGAKSADPVFLVICRDRHTDDVITVHRTREGADAQIEAFKSDYPRQQWTERAPNRRGSWIRYVGAGDDGPSARIQPCEVKP